LVQYSARVEQVIAEVSCIPSQENYCLWICIDTSGQDQQTLLTKFLLSPFSFPLMAPANAGLSKQNSPMNQEGHGHHFRPRLEEDEPGVQTPRQTGPAAAAHGAQGSRSRTPTAAGSGLPFDIQSLQPSERCMLLDQLLANAPKNSKTSNAKPRHGMILRSASCSYDPKYSGLGYFRRI